MNIQEILEHYDQMFGQYDLKEIEDYLVRNINEARDKQYLDILFTLLNEMIGFCRDTTQNDKGISYCKELRKVLDELNIAGSYEYATCLLNIANAYRAFAMHKESEEHFFQCEAIYKNLLNETDFGWANLYNNFGLLYQETGDYKKSSDVLYKALKVVDLYDGCDIQQAITRVNLAVSLIHMGDEESRTQALIYLNKALEIFVDDGERDFHYGACLVAMGDAYMDNDFSKAYKYYGLGLKELEKHVGKNDNYRRVQEKYEYAKNHMNKSHLELCKDYYETKCKNKLFERFSEYADRMAIGIVGEGSDCFGFEDEISKDHDFGIGFCIWLNEEDYQAIGKSLQEFYEELCVHQGLLKQRRGVMNINEFYNRLLMSDKDYESGDKIEFDRIDEYQLAVACNGMVFEDRLGLFTSIRNQLLNYYPDNLYRQKLANALHYFSQYAQSNYSRMMARNDYISAMLCKNKAIEVSMDLVYLINKEYAPYYKWKRKGLENNALGRKVIRLLDKLVETPLIKWNSCYSNEMINKDDKNIVLFEQLASLFKEELEKRDLIYKDELFLERHISTILESHDDVIEKIIKEEWDMFDKTQNIGGRASCQNNYPVFYIMRKSQYMTYNRELLDSYYIDLINAKNKGWNLISEKYARMMESTHYDEYKQLEQYLEKRNDKRIAIQEEIIRIQVDMMEQLTFQFPKMTSLARVIRTKEDKSDDTSYETYLRGELSTYSDRTFTLYGRLIIDMLKQDKNLAYEIMNNTAKLYGYKNIEDAELKI